MSGFPRWVLLDNRPTPVDHLAERPDKPTAVCPLCREEVVLVLNTTKRVRHYRHKHPSNCVASTPETAVHLNTKYHLADQLQKQPNYLIFQSHCCPDCRQDKTPARIEGWDRVEIEHMLKNGRRPDIVLLHQGEQIAAIEILVSNQKTAVVAKEYKQAGLRWFEVVAGNDILGWQQPQRFPTYWVRQDSSVAPCACDLAVRSESAFKRQQFAIVDRFYPDGRYSRAAYFIQASEQQLQLVHVSESGQQKYIGTWQRDQLGELLDHFINFHLKNLRDWSIVDLWSWQNFELGTVVSPAWDLAWKRPFRWRPSQSNLRGWELPRKGMDTVWEVRLLNSSAIYFLRQLVDGKAAVAHARTGKLLWVAEKDFELL